jgi:hypothetical protein
MFVVKNILPKIRKKSETANHFSLFAFFIALTKIPDFKDVRHVNSSESWWDEYAGRV